MANFEELLDRLKEEYPIPNTRGRPFERICIWWLKTDPTYAHTFKGIWSWYDWPDRLNRGFKDETGIDLVAETHTGILWAIQVKCYIDTQVPLKEVQGFLSLSGRKLFVTRVLISVGDLAEKAKVHVTDQEKPVKCLFKDDLNNSPVDWLDSFSFGSENINNPIDFLNRGTSYAKSEEYEKALVAYNKAIELDPEYADAYVVLFTGY